MHDVTANLLCVYDTAGQECFTLAHTYANVNCFAARNNYILGGCDQDVMLWKINQNSLSLEKTFTNVASNRGGEDYSILLLTIFNAICIVYRYILHALVRRRSCDDGIYFPG